MKAPCVYLNGEIVPADRAAISPFDIGLLRGYAVFDLLRTAGGRPFLLAEHLKRLRSSAAELELTVPVSDQAITTAIDDLLARNGHEEATVRIVLTGGVSPDGLSFDASTPTLLIITQELHLPAASVYENGTALVTEQHVREAPLAKTTNYITMIKGRSRTREAGALDLLYHDGAVVSEAASASFYIVRDSTVWAPERPVLWGTVGSWVLDPVRCPFPVVCADFSVDDALGADEAFLTSTTRGVVPIVRLDDRPVGDGSVGPVTKRLMRMWAEALGEA